MALTNINTADFILGDGVTQDGNVITVTAGVSDGTYATYWPDENQKHTGIKKIRMMANPNLGCSQHDYNTSLINRENKFLK